MHHITLAATFVNVSDPGKDSHPDNSALPLSLAAEDNEATSEH
jgi:hypothetical protein